MFSRTVISNPTSAGVGPGNQAIEVVAIRTVGAESFLVKKPFDSAAQANLVGITLRTNRPAHLTVPATPEQHHAGTGQTRGHKTERPQPLRLLLILTHNAEPITCLQVPSICLIQAGRKDFGTACHATTCLLKNKSGFLP